MDLPWKERQETLDRQYGFKCGCSQCNLPLRGIEASNDRLDRIDALNAFVRNFTSIPFPTTTTADLLIELYKLVSHLLTTFGAYFIRSSD